MIMEVDPVQHYHERMWELREKYQKQQISLKRWKMTGRWEFIIGSIKEEVQSLKKKVYLSRELVPKDLDIHHCLACKCSNSISSLYLGSVSSARKETERAPSLPIAKCRIVINCVKYSGVSPSGQYDKRKSCILPCNSSMLVSSFMNYDQ